MKVTKLDLTLAEAKEPDVMEDLQAYKESPKALKRWKETSLKPMYSRGWKLARTTQKDFVWVDEKTAEQAAVQYGSFLDTVEHVYGLEEVLDTETFKPGTAPLPYDPIPCVFKSEGKKIYLFDEEEVRIKGLAVRV